MLTAARLFSESVGAVRRQAWVLVPLFVARVLAGLVGLVPLVVLGARFLRAGFRSGATDATQAFVVGLLDDLDRTAPWRVAGVGGVLAAAGAWLLLIVVDAGALRLLAAQAGRRDAASDESFAEGMMRTPATWLVAGAGAALLMMIAFASAFGALGVALSDFTENPGVGTSALMALATLLIIVLPFVAAGLEVGFARAVILEEVPSVALGEGLFLAWERASALYAPWYLLLVAELAIAFGHGVGALLLSAFPGENGLWILRLGPQSCLWLLATAATTAVSFARLGLYATLVTEAAGTMPAPPPVAPRRPWAVAGDAMSDAPPLPAPSAAAASTEPAAPASPPDAALPSNPDDTPGQDGQE